MNRKYGWKSMVFSRMNELKTFRKSLGNPNRLQGKLGKSIAKAQGLPRTIPSSMPKYSESTVAAFFLRFGHFSQDRSKDNFKCSSFLPEMLERRPSQPQLGSSWRHICSNSAFAILLPCFSSGGCMIYCVAFDQICVFLASFLEDALYIARQVLYQRSDTRMSEFLLQLLRLFSM